MISEPMQTSLLEQLNREFRSAYLYLAMSAYCSSLEFNGAARWFKLQFEEEHLHATRIYDYLIDQGVTVTLLGLDEVPSDFGSLREVFEASLAHERDMTAHLNRLSDQALKETDHATYNMLQWFVAEQLEEEATLTAIIAKLRLVGTDGYGLLMVDNELGTRAAPSAGTPAP